MPIDLVEISIYNTIDCCSYCTVHSTHVAHISAAENDGIGLMAAVKVDHITELGLNADNPKYEPKHFRVKCFDEFVVLLFHNDWFTINN